MASCLSILSCLPAAKGFSKGLLWVIVFVCSVLLCETCHASLEDLRRAAEAGDASAQWNLGVKLWDGKDMPADPNEAIKWFRKASDQGYDRAQFDLGIAYFLGQGVQKNVSEAVSLWQKSAAQGYGMAQYNLGSCYYRGDGVPKDRDQAFRLLLAAANQGIPEAQYMVGVIYKEGGPLYYKDHIKWTRMAAMKAYPQAIFSLGWAYYTGQGVLQDYTEAMAWLSIAAGLGHQAAIEARDKVERKAGGNAAMLAQERSKVIVSEILANEQSEKDKANPDRKGPKEKNLKSSGTGVFVTKNGILLTAFHVIKDAKEVRVFTNQGSKTAVVVKVDSANDIAVLKCEGEFQFAPVKSSTGVKVGHHAFTIGFPNIDLQGLSPKLTNGEISSNTGYKDDPRLWQISAPVQPGNSGGPLFDDTGHLIGIVLSKLDAIKVGQATGDLPQNVNYALKIIYALPLLEQFESFSVSTKKSANPGQKLDALYEQAKGSVALILSY